MKKYIIYNDDNTIYDIRYEKDGWTLAKCQDAYSPKLVKEVEVTNNKH